MMGLYSSGVGFGNCCSSPGQAAAIYEVLCDVASLVGRAVSWIGNGISSGVHSLSDKVQSIWAKNEKPTPSACDKEQNLLEVVDEESLSFLGAEYIQGKIQKRIAEDKKKLEEFNNPKLTTWPKDFGHSKLS